MLPGLGQGNIGPLGLCLCAGAVHPFGVSDLSPYYQHITIKDGGWVTLQVLSFLQGRRAPKAISTPTRVNLGAVDKELGVERRVVLRPVEVFIPLICLIRGQRRIGSRGRLRHSHSLLHARIALNLLPHVQNERRYR